MITDVLHAFCQGGFGHDPAGLSASQSANARKCIRGLEQRRWTGRRFKKWARLNNGGWTPDAAMSNLERLVRAKEHGPIRSDLATPQGFDHNFSGRLQTPACRRSCRVRQKFCVGRTVDALQVVGSLCPAYGAAACVSLLIANRSSCRTCFSLARRVRSAQATDTALGSDGGRRAFAWDP